MSAPTPLKLAIPSKEDVEKVSEEFLNLPSRFGKVGFYLHWPTEHPDSGCCSFYDMVMDAVDELYWIQTSPRHQPNNIRGISYL